jgi:hypothetical protein
MSTAAAVERIPGDAPVSHLLRPRLVAQRGDVSSVHLRDHPFGVPLGASDRADTTSGLRYSDGTRISLSESRAASNSDCRYACRSAAGSARVSCHHERHAAVRHPFRERHDCRDRLGIGRTERCAEAHWRPAADSGRAATHEAPIRVSRLYCQVHRALWSITSRIRHRAPLPRLCAECQSNDANTRTARLHYPTTWRPSLDSNLHRTASTHAAPMTPPYFRSLSNDRFEETLCGSRCHPSLGVSPSSRRKCRFADVSAILFRPSEGPHR